MADLSEEQELIATYLKHCRDRAEETFWAWEELDDIAREEAEGGWLLIEKIVEAANTKEELGNLGVGALEDWVNNFGEQFKENIETAARTNKKFAYALSMIDIYEEDSDLEKFIYGLQEKYGVESFESE